MTPLYLMIEPLDFGVDCGFDSVDTVEKNWWSLEVVSRATFEDGSHLLNPVDDDYESISSDVCRDFHRAGPGLWAVSERAWDWLPSLEESGCRIAHNVKVSRGKKRFKLLYPAPILDLLDHEKSHLTWGGDTISWVDDIHLYEWTGMPPFLFQVLFHNKAPHRGVMCSPSMRCFASQLFVDEYARRGLSGLEFHEIPRTKRPTDSGTSSNVVIYRP